MWEEETVIQEGGQELKLQYAGTSSDGQVLGLKVMVRSGLFTGEHEFELHKSLVDEAAKSLAAMHRALQGKYEIHDGESASYLWFEMYEGGHMEVRGVLTGRLTDRGYQELFRFVLYTDQTTLPRMIEVLREILVE